MKPTHLGITQQLHHPTLIRRESSNLPYYRPHKFGLGRLDALTLAGAHGLGDGGCGVAMVDAITQIYEGE